MAQQHRYPQQRSRDNERGGNFGRDWDREDYGRSASERDRYQTGGERRYSADWGDDSRRQSAFDGDRSYSAGGYSEEQGYRSEGSGRRDYGGERERGYPYQGSGPNWESRNEARGPQRGDDRHLYRDFNAHWDSREDDQGYYGTGHQSGAFGTAAGTRATSGSGDYGFYGSREGGLDFYGRRSYEGDTMQGGGYSRSGGYGGGSQYTGEQDWRNRRSGVGYGSQSPRYGSQSSYGRNAQDFGSGQQPSYGAQQSFRGRGPKGYQRSDDRLKEIICEQLMEDPDIDASEVNIEVSGSVVTLTGTIDDRRTKYEIEDIIERVGGVRDINNQLRVESGASRAQASTQWGSGGSKGEKSSTSSASTGSVNSPSTSGSSGSTSPSKRN